MELPRLFPTRLFLAALLLSLSACGGQNEDNPATNTGTLLPTVFTSEGRILNSCSFNPVCSSNPFAPFFSNTSVAPADGATLSGIVRLEANGNDMANVELLPASGYSPKFGVFNRTGDKTRAWLDFDTTRLPNGPVTVRISAFNVPAGQNGIEIVAMPARTWNIHNASLLPAPFSATLVSAPPNGAVLSGITRLEVRGRNIVNAELLPASGYHPRLGVFNVSADRTLAWLDLDSRSLGDGSRDVRISVFNVTEGQAGAQEIVAMPARRWEVRNGTGFTASVTMAPLHGEIVSGVTRLEVRGNGIRNVELLPASGYLPRLGVFNVSGDGTFAWLEFNTSTLPNGLLDARISAFNVPQGQPGAVEIIAMPTRLWNLRRLPSAAASTFLAPTATFDTPTAIAYDSRANVFYVTSGAGTVRRLTANGSVTTIAGAYQQMANFGGGPDGPGTMARFTKLTGIAVGSDQNLYVTDATDLISGNGRIRQIDAIGTVRTIVTGIYSQGITADGHGNLFFTRNFGGFKGVEMTTLAGGTPVSIATGLIGPRGITMDSTGSLIVSNTGPDFLGRFIPSCSIEKVNSSGTGAVIIVAGSRFAGSLVDGKGTCGFADSATPSEAQFSELAQGVAAAADGTIYVADTNNHVIRKIAATGGVTTLAGSPGIAGSSDGTGAAARFNRPFGIAIAADDNLYVADTDNHIIRCITPEGVVTTIAGTAGKPGNLDVAGLSP